MPHARAFQQDSNKTRNSVPFSVRYLTERLIKTSVAEAAQSNATLGSSGLGLAVTPSGKVTGGSVSINGVISISGDNTSASVGTAVTVILTPSILSDGKLTWVCSTSAATMHRYVPSECRH